jgi:site-specific DNA recombinase
MSTKLTKIDLGNMSTSNMSTVDNTRAVSYTRYSSEMQRATSIEDQQRNCTRRANAEGWAVTAQYADEAISGSDNRRPQYLAMLQAAARKEFDVLIIDDLSRPWRDSVEQETAIRRLEFQGIRIVSTSDGYDSQSKSRKIQRGFKGMMNEIFLDDLRDKVHRGQEGQAERGFWNGGRPYGYRLRPVLDPSRHDPYGQPVRVGTHLEIDPEQATIVKRIFERFVEGASALTICRELNESGVPSPGSTWRRKVRRCQGWMASAVRAMLMNPLFTGQQRWNTSQYLKDPDTGKDRRRARPKAEWRVHLHESLRIVSDELFESAQARTRKNSKSDERLKTGGKPKYLLTGLLFCELCDSKYTMGDKAFYCCAAHWGGRACSNTNRVRRDEIEARLLIDDDSPIGGLLAPERVARMAAELEQLYAEHIRQSAARAEQAPKELRELAARIERLRERLRTGDADMAPDEIEAAIGRAEGKLRELQARQPSAKESARLLSMLPRAAELYRRQVANGLSGDIREALKARVTLRNLVVDGKIVLSPGEGGSLWAKFSMQPAAILLQTTGTSGRGDRIWTCDSYVPNEVGYKN